VVEVKDPTGLFSEKDVEDYYNNRPGYPTPGFSEEKFADNMIAEAYDYLNATAGRKFAEAVNKLLKEGSVKNLAETILAFKSVAGIPSLKGVFESILKSSVKSITGVTQLGENHYRVSFLDNDGKISEEEYYTDSDGNVYKKDSSGGWWRKEGSGWRTKWVPCDAPIRPADPDSNNDPFQSILIENALRKMLKLGEEKSIYEEGPVIEFESESPSGSPRKIFIFNPFYRGKDPMEEIIWRIKTDSGMWGFVRNPFAPGGDHDLGTTTYEKIRQKGFVQPEVDPYWK